MRKIYVLALLMMARAVFAQEVLENNPPSVKWRELVTPNFRIVYPGNFSAEAQRVANSLEHIRTLEAQTLSGSLPRRIPVILQTQSSVSNGFVSMLPRRSEFYAMPSQNYNFTGTNDWLDMLTAHEYRHIVQFQHATRGFNKVLYYAFGSTTLAGMAQAAAPGWFWEGDAVATETAFTRSGRGSIPHFSLAFRTNLLEGRAFNYHKQHLGSFRHHIPNEYVLGFHLVSYLRKRTGDPNIWGKITGRSWSIPFIPFAFSNAIKKETGLYVTDLYREMAEDFQTQWNDHLAGLTLTPFEPVNIRDDKAYTDYRYPQPLANGDVVALRSGIGDIEELVVIRNGAVRKIFTPGFINDAGMLSAEGNVVVWNEYGFDPRWRVRNYSLVKTIDVEDRRVRVVGPRRARYGSAAISPDGSKVVTVRTTTAYETNLVVLDYRSGAELYVIPNPEQDFYSMPRWAPDSERIVVLRTGKQGRTIALVDVSSGVVSDILPYTNENKGHPVLSGDYLFYNSGVTGIDNIFAYHLTDGRTFQVTSSRYGAYNPAISPDGKYIYYNEQTRNGLDIVRIPFRPSRWHVFEGAGASVDHHTHLIEQEGAPDVFASVPKREYASRKYSKLKGLINPYAWGLNVETDLTEAQVGISSRDILSTTSVQAGYVFDINERTASWEGRVSYQALYPVIDVSASLADRKSDVGRMTLTRILDEDTVQLDYDVVFSWKEKNLTAGLRIPLLLTNGKYMTNLHLGNAVGVTAVSGFRNNVDGGGRLFPSELPQQVALTHLDNGRLVYNHLSMTASRLLKRSRRDINSRWGQQVFANAYHTPYGGDFYGRQLSVYSVLYFPGLFKHHSLWGYAAYQYAQRDLIYLSSGAGLNQYTFRNQVPLPRGQTVSRHQRYAGFSVNYTLPIWYPDIAIGPLVNFQRLRATLFYDQGEGRTHLTELRTNFWNSAGVELRLDLNIMRFAPRFDIGVRFARGLSPATNSVEFLIGSFNF